MIPQDPLDSETIAAGDHFTEPLQLFHLAGAGDFRAESAKPALPEQVSGMPAFYYWKDAIVVGSYIHPARRFSLDITRDRLDGYVLNFGRMKTNGVGVPILMDHAPTASATLGWIVEVKREGNRLMELHQFLGESARDIGLRNKVSLGIDPHFVDGKGTDYGEAIVHSAVTPVPVVPNQGDFEPVMLGNGDLARGGDVIELSWVSGEPDQIAGADDKSFDPANEITDPGDRQESKSNHGRHPAIVPAASVVPAVDHQLAMHALEQVAAIKRDLALSRGAIDPAVADELFDLLVKPREGALNTLLLSRAGNGSSIAIAVFDALSRNRPAPLGETTAIQVLSRITPGDDGGDLRQRMIALASGHMG